METFFFTDTELNDLRKLLGQSVTMLAAIAFEVSRDCTISVSVDGSLAIEYSDLDVMDGPRRYVNLENSLRDAGDGRVWDVPKIIVSDQAQPRDFQLWYPDRRDLSAPSPPDYVPTPFSAVEMMHSTKLLKWSKVQSIEILENFWDDDVSSDSGIRVVFEDDTCFAVAVDRSILCDVKFAFTEATVAMLLKDMTVRRVLSLDDSGT